MLITGYSGKFSRVFHFGVSWVNLEPRKLLSRNLYLLAVHGTGDHQEKTQSRYIIDCKNFILENFPLYGKS